MYGKGELRIPAYSISHRCASDLPQRTKHCGAFENDDIDADDEYDEYEQEKYLAHVENSENTIQKFSLALSLIERGIPSHSQWWSIGRSRISR